MPTILPEGFDEVISLLNHWDAKHCPKCGGVLSFDMLYCGGRGYKQYEICQSEGDCSYMRRVN